ncbi:MAG: hypothetical protein M1353_10070 [Nitrospirae bacterium]|nr:hypothetical protein [Nitrospirota bacterium]
MLRNSMSGLDSLEKKLYQLVIGRLDGDNIQNEDYRKRIIGLVKKGIGGFIIFGGMRSAIKGFITEIQSIAEIPLFIASDIERGVGQQIKGATPFPCQMAVAAAIDRNRQEDAGLLEDAIKAVAAEALDIGINMPLIPVMDVNLNPDNPIICTRAFSDNPRDVAWFGSRYIKILEASGLISCAKHFPGHGDTSIDSHIALPVINKSESALMNTDVMPFVEAIKTGASSIMIGHLTVPALDSRPASLSKKVINGLLREKLGFGGLILTDALNMNALSATGNVPVECIRAGADILLHPADADLTVRELMAAAGSGKIAEERIDASLRRIAEVKAGLQSAGAAEADYSGHKELSSLIAGRAITLIKNKAGLMPLSDDGTQLIFAGDRKYFEHSPLRGHFKDTVNLADINELRQGTAVCAVFTGVAAWKGSSGMESTERQKLSGLIDGAKKSIVISFGSPYVLRHFPEADILVAAYDATGQAQEAVIKRLQGEADFKGRLPVRLDARARTH